LNIPNTIQNGQPADGDELQENFAAVASFSNQEVINRDGSTAMLQPLLLPGAPTQPNHASNKGYVDTSLTTGKAYTDTKDATQKTYIDTQDGVQKTYTNGVATQADAGFTAPVGAPLMFQAGFWNGNTDPNGYARIDWPIQFKGIPLTGDVGNRGDCGVVCMSARGSGDVLAVGRPGVFALGGFNGKDAIIRVFDTMGGAVPNLYVVFHWIAWGPRP